MPYHCAGLRVLAGAPGEDGRLRTGHRFCVALLEPQESRGGKRDIQCFLKSGGLSYNTTAGLQQFKVSWSNALVNSDENGAHWKSYDNSISDSFFFPLFILGLNPLPIIRTSRQVQKLQPTSVKATIVILYQKT